MAKNYGGSNVSYALIKQQGAQFYDISEARVVDGQGNQAFVKAKDVDGQGNQPFVLDDQGNPIEVRVDPTGYFCETVKGMMKTGDIGGVSELERMVVKTPRGERFLELPHDQGSVRYHLRVAKKPEWETRREARAAAKRAAEVPQKE